MTPDSLSPVPADEPLPPARVLDADAPLRIARLDTFVFRYPLDTPVRTSFGAMTDRPAVLVRVEDAGGAHGWGEVWCNYPSCGAEHRALLVRTEIAPRLMARGFAGPGEAFLALEASLRVLALQTGEWGPIAQCLAGVDIALWDLAARRAGRPLADMIAGGAARRAVPAYASGINPQGAADTVARIREAGHGAFKVKIGFGDGDRAVLEGVAATLRPGERMMADANQAWSHDEARRMADVLGDLPLDWLEEPLHADRPLADWRALSAAARMPLAAGENLRGLGAFEAAAGSGCFGVIQPDICKWGGISGGVPAARAILAAGRRYCPHYLGAGIGLVASAHVLAAVGGDGMLEIDANPNPLRETLADPLPRIAAGAMHLDWRPGLGAGPDLAAARGWLVAEAGAVR